MANQNISIPINHTSVLTIKAFDGATPPNDITGLCSFTATSSNPSTVLVGGNQVIGWQIKGVAMGTASITRTASNSAGTETETDTLTITEPAPVSQTATYSTPQ